jgi:hypothetical protein
MLNQIANGHRDSAESPSIGKAQTALSAIGLAFIDLPRVGIEPGKVNGNQYDYLFLY